MQQRQDCAKKSLRPKAAFLLFPTLATPEMLDEHFKKIIAKFPDSTVLISVSRERNDLVEYAYESGFFSGVFIYENKEGHWKMYSRAKVMIAAAVEEHADILFFNTGPIRYGPEIFTNFALDCESRHSVFMVGEPPVLHPDNNPEIRKALEDIEVRKNLMVDIFTSFAICRSCKDTTKMFGQFINLNAGIFAVRCHHSSWGDNAIVRKILEARQYDSNLVALLIAWELSRDSRGFGVSPVAVPTINMEPFKDGFAERIKEMNFILDVLEKRAPRKTLEDLGREVFDEAPNLRIVFADEHRRWFLTEVLNLQREEELTRGRGLIKVNPAEHLPEPDHCKPKK